MEKSRRSSTALVLRLHHSSCWCTRHDLYTIINREATATTSGGGQPGRQTREGSERAVKDTLGGNIMNAFAIGSGEPVSLSILYTHITCTYWDYSSSAGQFENLKI